MQNALAFCNTFICETFLMIFAYFVSHLYYTTKSQKCETFLNIFYKFVSHF